MTIVIWDLRLKAEVAINDEWTTDHTNNLMKAIKKTIQDNSFGNMVVGQIDLSVGEKA